MDRHTRLSNLRSLYREALTGFGHAYFQMISTTPHYLKSSCSKVLLGVRRARVRLPAKGAPGLNVRNTQMCLVGLLKCKGEGKSQENPSLERKRGMV